MERHSKGLRAGVDWWEDNRWHCGVCNQSTDTGAGPWCELYRPPEHVPPCRPLTKQWLRDADDAGDGPLVNALCAYGRRMWGEDLDW
jgi:hypothetical protein